MTEHGEGNSSDRRTVLGDFVFSSQTQDPVELNQGRINHVARNRAQDLVFGQEPFEAKIWYAPRSECNGEARDIVVEPNYFGNLQEVMCRAWSDRIRSDRCSYAIVRPQPSEHYHLDILHFLTFETDSFSAVPIRQTTSSSGEVARMDFCACAFSFRDYARFRFNLDQGQQCLKGELVTFHDQRRESICQRLSIRRSLRRGTAVVRYGVSAITGRNHLLQTEWKSLGGELDPIVLMVFPTPAKVVMPVDHLVMMPYGAYDQEQRVFLIDVLSGHAERPLIERVAVRGTKLTPRKIASQLGYHCDTCSVRRGRCQTVFRQDQEIRYSTGSYILLDVTNAKDSKVHCESKQLQRVSPVQDFDIDEMGLFQFEPPPRMNVHGDNERYFWVRNTVFFLPAVSLALLEIGHQATGHWPLTVVYFRDLPHETRTFGFLSHDLVNLDEYRVRFRELYADQFRTDETVSIGLVDVNLFQHQRVQMHELELIAFRNRVPFHMRPVLVCIRFFDGRAPITPRAVLFPRAITKQDVIESVLFSRECGRQDEQCLASTASGITIGQAPMRIDSWQRIFLDVFPAQEGALDCIESGEGDFASTLGTRHVHHESEDVNLMQTSMVPNSRPGYLEMYAFSIADRFVGSAPEEQVWVSTYCHLWRDRDHPGRNHRPIVVTRGQAVRDALMRIWSPPIERDNLAVTPVRPMPEIGAGLRPAVIVTDYEDEHTIPILFDYTSDDRTFIGTGLIGCHFGFPEVHDLFDLLIPGNLCRTVTSCLVRAHGRHFVPGQTVMIFAGLFVKLAEQDLEETTSENVTSTDYGVVMSRASTTGLSSDVSLQPGPPNSDTDRQELRGHFPTLNLPGPFFDWNQEGELYAIGYELSPDASLLWFQVIAVQRTEFQQMDQMLGENAQVAQALSGNGGLIGSQ